jgi:DNA-binding CsgD family transcriptional regulator
MLVVLGKGPKDIGRACGISVSTAKEYVADVYERLGVHTRTGFLARLTGAAN